MTAALWLKVKSEQAVKFSFFVGILPIIGFNVNQQGSKGSVLIRTLGFKYYHIKGADGKYDVYRGGFSTKNGFNFSFRIISDSENELKASPERELLH